MWKLLCILSFGPLFITNRAISAKVPGKYFFSSLCLLPVIQPGLEYIDFKGGSWGKAGGTDFILHCSNTKLESNRTRKNERHHKADTKSLPHQIVVFRSCLQIHARKASPGLRNVRTAYNPCPFRMKASDVAREKGRPPEPQFIQNIGSRFQKPQKCHSREQRQDTFCRAPKVETKIYNEDSHVKLDKAKQGAGEWWGGAEVWAWLGQGNSACVQGVKGLWNEDGHLLWRMVHKSESTIRAEHE